MNIQKILMSGAAIVSFLSLSGCDLSDASFGAKVCLGDFIEIGNGGTNINICAEIGNGNMVGAPIQEDGLMIEIMNVYAEEAMTDPNYEITQMNLSCLVEDSDGDIVPAAPYIYTDGLSAIVYIPSIPSHFDAECTGSITIGGGPASSLFVDDNAVAETTMVMWEDEVIDDGDWKERNGELRIDND
ncbi:hypothetical protein HON52_04195 [Candidatus Uhrbacteria bacterium]|jgi:hypothetical protein|nr:hypothetical protein [Candidatus Uhrbacteria bacterium]